jgi:hypothetical protein
MRTISFTSSVDLTGMFFTIIGEQNGISITEIVTGPAAGSLVVPVQSINYYDKIKSIQASAGAADISVGRGSTTRIFFNSGSGFSSSRFCNPYIKLSIDNPSGATSNTTTRVDGLNGFPDNLLRWEPDSLVATKQGTRSVKAEDTIGAWEYTKADLELYRGFIVTVEGFPADSVYVFISQP